MIYIYEDGRVIYDGSTISEEERNKAIVVANKPIEENFEGKIAVLKWNIEDQTAWYEYVNIIPTEGDKLVLKVQSLEEENAELLMKSAMSEMKMEGLESDISELMIKVATLEMGGNI